MLIYQRVYKNGDEFGPWSRKQDLWMIRRSGHLETEKKDLSLGLGVANKICGR